MRCSKTWRGAGRSRRLLLWIPRTRRRDGRRPRGPRPFHEPALHPSSEDADELARLVFLAQAAGRGSHQANGQRATASAGSIGPGPVPQMIVDEDRLARARRQWHGAFVGAGLPKLLLDDDAAFGRRQSVEMTSR